MNENLQLRDELLSREELREKFGVLNYLIFFAMLLLSALIGVFNWMREKKTTEDFLLANRSMSTLPMTLSLAVSFMSAISMLGTPAEVYFYGTIWMTATLGTPIAIAIVIHFFLPVYDRLRLTTSYEYLELRFNKAVKLSVSSLFLLHMVLYMAIAVYAPALALIQVTGFLNGIDYDIEITCAIIFAVCIFYSSIGGIKAVIWTDSLQAVIMIVSLLAITIYGTEVVGGYSKVFDINYQAGRVDVLNFDLDPRQRVTTWGIIIKAIILMTSLYGTNQAMVQRYSTVKKKSQVVTALWLNSVCTIFLTLSCCYAGLVVFAFYHDCDPKQANQIGKADQILPLFVMQLMGDIPGLPGLFVAGVFSGALSTISSGLNSLAAVFLTDFLQGGCKVQLSEQRKTLITKFISCGFGIISFAFVFVVRSLPGVLAASIQLFGVIGGPVLGVFSLGMFFPFCNVRGALVGLISSLGFVSWAAVGQIIVRDFEKTYDNERFSPIKPSTIEQCPSNWTSHAILNTVETVEASTNTSSFVHLWLYDMSYFWYGPLSLLICLTVGCLVSLCQPQDHRLLDPRLVSPNTPTFFCWTPNFIKRKIKTYFLSVGCQFGENASMNDISGKPSK